MAATIAKKRDTVASTRYVDAITQGRMIKVNVIDFRLAEGKHGVTDVHLVIDGRDYPNLFDFLVIAATPHVPIVCCDVFTCSCGHAGCAGYTGCTIIESDEDTMRWSCHEGAEIPLGANGFVFDRATYGATMARLEAEVCRRADAGEKFVLLGDIDYGPDGEEISGQLEPRMAFQDIRSHLSRREQIEFARETKRDFASVPAPQP